MWVQRATGVTCSGKCSAEMVLVIVLLRSARLGLVKERQAENGLLDNAFVKLYQ